jgi:predicted NACHT family NTPase
VIGSAGAGKTMFIRYLFLQMIEGNFGIIPIFIELRGLNSTEYKGNLIQFIHESVVRPGAVVTKDQFNACLRENMFILILDGLDEVEHDSRPEVERQIANLREAYPNLGIVISSRPDDRLAAWVNFKLYHIQPMKKPQVKKLISKLPYDAQLRSQFIKEVDEHLYDRHQSFLSNPLLATMMLMTFDQFAHIPDKIHIFYEQAFETLFSRHDAGKQAAFRRKMYTDLAINDFRNCLSAVCVSSYFKQKLEFSETEILNCIRAAALSQQLNIGEREYLKDLLESICILQRDGLFITFTHRSFQEYFAACFISRSPSTSIRDLLDKICLHRDNNVIPMAFDMNKPLIEREWILPRIKDLSRKITRSDFKDNIVALANAMNLNINVDLDQSQKKLVMYLKVTPGFAFMQTLKRLYDDNLYEYDLHNQNDLEIVGGELDRRRAVDGSMLELRTTDHEWVMQTTLAQYIQKVRDALLGIRVKVEASVSEQKKLEGVLFE